MNNNITIRCCPICGSKARIVTKVGMSAKYINTDTNEEYGYEPYVIVAIKCSNKECDYIPVVSATGELAVPMTIEKWNDEVHKFEQVRVSSQLKGRAEGEK